MNGSEQKTVNEKQVKAIGIVLNAKSIEAGCKLAGISKTLYYGWLKNPLFVEEVKRQRDISTAEALDKLRKSLSRAVDTLVDLLNSQSETTKRYVANDIITHVLKTKELQDLDERLTAIERVITERKGGCRC